MSTQVKSKSGPASDLEVMYALEEIADIGRVSVRQVRRWCEEGRLRFVQLPRGRRIPASAWSEFVAANTQEADER